VFAPAAIARRAAAVRRPRHGSPPHRRPRSLSPRPAKPTNLAAGCGSRPLNATLRERGPGAPAAGAAMTPRATAQTMRSASAPRRRPPLYRQTAWRLRPALAELAVRDRAAGAPPAARSSRHGFFRSSRPAQPPRPAAAPALAPGCQTHPAGAVPRSRARQLTLSNRAASTLVQRPTGPYRFKRARALKGPGVPLIRSTRPDRFKSG
jgi:hypothetical protein